jgi:hypothetical protein
MMTALKSAYYTGRASVKISPVQAHEMTGLYSGFIAVFVFIGIAQVTDGLAQTYPARSVRVIVPYAAGGGSPILGRMIGAKASEELGQQLVIDNRARRA